MTTPQHSLDVVRYHPNELNSFHQNPRRGDIDAIAQSLQVNGQYRPVVVNLGTHTGRPLEVLAGNHTLAAARKLKWQEVAATTVDVDDQAAARCSRGLMGTMVAPVRSACIHCSPTARQASSVT